MTLEELKPFLCIDCRQDTYNEYYMVKDRVWLKAHPKRRGMLCIGCLEKRLKRNLYYKDFSGAPVNWMNWFGQEKSERLLNRLHGRRKI